MSMWTVVSLPTASSDTQAKKCRVISSYTLASFPSEEKFYFNRKSTKANQIIVRLLTKNSKIVQIEGEFKSSSE